MKKNNRIHISVKNIKKVSDIFAKNVINKNHTTVQTNQKDTVFVYKKQSNDYIEWISELLYHIRAMQNVGHTPFYMTLQKQQIQNILNISVFSNELKEMKNLFLSQQNWDTVFVEEAITYVEDIIKKNNKINSHYLEQKKKYFESKNIKWNDTYFYNNYKNMEKFKLLYIQKQIEKQKIKKEKQILYPYYYLYENIDNVNKINEVLQYINLNNTISDLKNNKYNFLKYFNDTKYNKHFSLFVTKGLTYHYDKKNKAKSYFLKYYNNILGHHNAVEYKESSTAWVNENSVTNVILYQNKYLRKDKKQKLYPFLRRYYKPYFLNLRRDDITFKKDKIILLYQSKEDNTIKKEKIVQSKENLYHYVLYNDRKNKLQQNILLQNKVDSTWFNSHKITYILRNRFEKVVHENTNHLMMRNKNYLMIGNRNDYFTEMQYWMVIKRLHTDKLFYQFYSREYKKLKKKINRPIIKRDFKQVLQKEVFHYLKQIEALYHELIKEKERQKKVSVTIQKKNKLYLKEEKEYSMLSETFKTKLLLYSIYNNRQKEIEKITNKIMLLKNRSDMKEVLQKKVFYHLKQIKALYHESIKEKKKQKKVSVTIQKENKLYLKEEKEYSMLSETFKTKLLYNSYDNRQKKEIEKIINRITLLRNGSNINRIQHTTTFKKLDIERLWHHIIFSKNAITSFDSLNVVRKIELMEGRFIYHLQKQLYFLENNKKTEIEKKIKNINVPKQKQYLKKMIYNLNKNTSIISHLHSEQKYSIEKDGKQNGKPQKIVYYLHYGEEIQTTKYTNHWKLLKFKGDIKQIQHKINLKKWNNTKALYLLNKDIQNQIIKNRKDLLLLKKENYFSNITHSIVSSKLNYDTFYLYYDIQKEIEKKIQLQLNNKKRQFMLLKRLNQQKMQYYLHNKKESKIKKEIQKWILLNKENNFNKMEKTLNHNSLLSKIQQYQKIVTFMKKGIEINSILIMLEKSRNIQKEKQFMVWNQKNFTREEIQQNTILKNNKEMLFNRDSIILLQQSDKYNTKQIEQNTVEIQQQLKQMIEKEVETLLKKQLEQQQITLQNYKKEIINQQEIWEKQFDKEKLYQQVYQRLERTLQHEKRQWGK